MGSHLVKKVLGWLGWVVLAVILGTVSFVLVAVRQGWEFDAVLSGSMEPALNVGGLVVIRPAIAQEIKTRDIISFKLPGIDTPICHRVIGIQEKDGQRIFQTKGDANEEPDQNLVPASSVTGKAVFYTPYVGRLAEVSRIGRTPVVLMGRTLPVILIVILAMGLIFIGLTLKDTLDDIFHPAKRCKREMLKKRKERLLRRKKALYLN